MQGMSLIYDPDETIEFRYVNPQDPTGEQRLTPRTWPEDSYITIYRFRNQAKLEAMAKGLATTKLKYDRDEERRFRRSGKDGEYQGEQEMIAKKTGTLATLEAAIVAWRGSGFYLPPKFKIPGTKTLHPYAGQQMPCEPDYIPLLDPSQIKVIEDFIDVCWRNPDADEEEIFRLSGQNPFRSVEPARPESGNAVAAGTP